MKFVMMCFCLGGLGVVSMVGAAEEPGTRHGSIPMKLDGIMVEAGTTVTLQHASDARSEDELLASLDIVSSIPTANGQWLVYVEGNTSPRRNGVTVLIPAANTDAGTALDRDDTGRLQVSVLHYMWFLGSDALVVGLINPAGPLDNSDIANDETQQFLGSTLVNNPTIAFPDYTLGMVYFYKPDGNGLDLTFMLSSSHGLADNPNKSYSELTDVSDDTKGVFAVTEAVWRQSQHTWRGGLWLQTAANAYLDGSGKTASNYGAYLSADYQLAEYGLNLRLGWANPKVSEAAQFIGAALDRALGKNHAGIGYTYTFVSNDAGADKGDRSQLEAYYRFALAANLSLTPSLQHIRNAGFDNSGTSIDRNVNVISVRTSYTF
jgi:hypothetical protein